MSIWTEGYELLKSPDAGLAETLTRNPAGVTADGIAVEDCIFQETTLARDRSRGDSTMRTGVLEIPEERTVLLADTWTIGNELWQVVTLGRVQNGKRIAELRRDDKRETIASRRDKYQ